MTVKIVQEAEVFEPIKLGCDRCGCKLVADSPDDFKRYSNNFQYDPDDYAFLICPTEGCGNRIRVDSKHFPRLVYHNLQRAR